MSTKLFNLAKIRMLPIKRKLFSIPHFDAEMESLFWRERQEELHQTLEAALLLGSSVFLAFLAVKSIDHELALPTLPARLLIVFALTGLFLWLHAQRPR